MTLLTVILTGAAVIREREHGTLEHLLVMPLNAFEIAMAKIWANSLVILVFTALSLRIVVMELLESPFAGSVTLWFSGVLLYLFFATALGLFLGTISRSMAQFALLIIIVVLVLQLLSGGNTPVEKSTGMVAIYDLLSALSPFRELLASHHLSGRRISRRLAAVRDGRRNRPSLFRL